MLRKTLGPKCTRQNDWIIYKRPCVRVLRILPAKRGEELSRLELQIRRQRSGSQIRLFQLDVGVLLFLS